MESATTIRKMMAGNSIIVPRYQRAYSWDTPVEGKEQITQTDIFLSDLEEYSRSGSLFSYNFGHFLFEKKEDAFCVIDGQQRLTTIVIFLSALFSRLKKIRTITEEEENSFEDMIKRKSAYRFSTVDYDNQFFRDYVIDQIKLDCNSLETESARRISRAFDSFKSYLSEKKEKYLVDMLRIISVAACTTHPIKNESEAIQMFIFQNNRGKRPSNLEIVKAQFMYTVHLHGGDDTQNKITEIKERFEKIYKSISSIEYRISEDDVLLYSLRVYFNSLWESNSLKRIKDCLSGDDPITFIENFTQTLSSSFEHLETFFGKDERDHFAIHSFIALTGIGVGLPFIIKAYSYGIPISEKERLCAAIESLVLRHRLIGTRAVLTSRINDVFVEFTKNNFTIEPILELVEWMKPRKDWWGYWNNENLKASLEGEINHQVAKYLLWKYEVHLEGQGKSGYKPSRFDRIENPELEHIAPKTEPSEISHGYDEYDEEFQHQYIDCLGNYLLLSKSHNCAVGNVPFPAKIETYLYNEQQREVRKIGLKHGDWTRNLIQERKERIIDFILETF